MEPKQQRFSLWYFLIVLGTLMLLQSVFFAPHRETLSYSELKALLGAGKVRQVLIERERITGTFVLAGLDSLLPKERVAALKRDTTSPHPFVTTRIEDPALVSQLEAAKVPLR